jgi:hypothetical protein
MMVQKLREEALRKLLEERGLSAEVAEIDVRIGKKDVARLGGEIEDMIKKMEEDRPTVWVHAEPIASGVRRSSGQSSSSGRATPPGSMNGKDFGDRDGNTAAWEAAANLAALGTGAAAGPAF